MNCISAENLIPNSASDPKWSVRNDSLALENVVLSTFFSRVYNTLVFFHTGCFPPQKWSDKIEMPHHTHFISL